MPCVMDRQYAAEDADRDIRLKARDMMRKCLVVQYRLEVTAKWNE